MDRNTCGFFFKCVARLELDFLLSFSQKTKALKPVYLMVTVLMVYQVLQGCYESHFQCVQVLSSFNLLILPKFLETPVFSLIFWLCHFLMQVDYLVSHLFWKSLLNNQQCVLNVSSVWKLNKWNVVSDCTALYHEVEAGKIPHTVQP